MSVVRARPRTAGATALAVTLALTLAACGGDSEASSSTTSADGSTTVDVAAVAGAPYRATPIKVETVDAIRAQLPASVRDSGELVIGEGALPAGFPPLAFVGTDQKTLTGAEPDLGRLVAAVLGLKPKVENATWENLFVGIDSGRTDIGFSNITVTEQRKLKYDFASYRQDNLGFEVKKDNAWNFDGDYTKLDGQVVSVGKGTNQEKILLEWKTKLEAQGKGFEVRYFPDQNGINLALASGKITVYFGPNPGIAYNVAQRADGPAPFRNAGTYSGAGETLQGLIAATSKKGSGLAQPVAAAIQHLIDDGQYAQWLKAYDLANEAVDKSEVNPPGLPLDNS